MDEISKIRRIQRGLNCPKWADYYLENHKNRYLDNLQLIKEACSKDSSILNIGAAPFHIDFILKEQGYEVISVDLNPKRFQQLIERADIEAIKCDIEKESLPFEDDRFDDVLLLEVFEHLRINPISTLREINRVTAEGGKLILSTPNLYSVYKLTTYLLGEGLEHPVEQFKKLDEKGHMGHVRVYSSKEVSRFLEETGFKVNKIS